MTIEINSSVIEYFNTSVQILSSPYIYIYIYVCNAKTLQSINL